MHPLPAGVLLLGVQGSRCPLEACGAAHAQHRTAGQPCHSTGRMHGVGQDHRLSGGSTTACSSCCLASVRMSCRRAGDVHRAPQDPVITGNA